MRVRKRWAIPLGAIFFSIRSLQSVGIDPDTVYDTWNTFAYIKKVKPVYLNTAKIFINEY